MEKDYRASVDEERVRLIRSILKELPQACGDFIRNISTTTSTLTRLAYVYDLRIFFGFLTAERLRFSTCTSISISDFDLAAITQSDIEAYVEYLTIYYKNQNEDEPDSNQRVIQNHELGIMRKLSSLRSFFDYLYRSKRIPGNVATLVPLPKLHEKPILRMELDEVTRMLAIAQNGDKLTPRQQKYQKITQLRDYAILCLFLGTGIRVSECVGIDIDDLDFYQNACLVTRKGGNQVMIYFPQEVADALFAYLEQRKEIETLPGHEQALFLSLQKRRITQRAVQNLVKKYAVLAAPLKKKISPHKLRSTFGTNLYKETGDIYLVADVLGHSDVNTTRKHYAAMSEKRRREAVKFVKYQDGSEQQEEKD